MLPTVKNAVNEQMLRYRGYVTIHHHNGFSFGAGVLYVEIRVRNHLRSAKNSAIRDIMQAEAVHQPAYGYHTTPAKPPRNTNTHRTRAIQPMK